MSTNMSFALPEAMRSYVDQRVRSGQYGNTSEYLRELIRRDQEEQAKKRLRDLVEEGLNSGPGQALTPQRTAQHTTTVVTQYVVRVNVCSASISGVWTYSVERSSASVTSMSTMNTHDARCRGSYSHVATPDQTTITPISTHAVTGCSKSRHRAALTPTA
jgi:antitoxin ParD1/3/4